MATGKTFDAEKMITHLRETESHFWLRRKSVMPEWSDAEFHESSYQLYPELYALGALASSVQVSQQIGILFQLLRASRNGFSDEVRKTLDRVTVFLLTTLCPDHVLEVFLALKRVHANHKHTRRAILKYILNHPYMENMAAWRRPSLRDSMEHALGKNTCRACAKLAAGYKESSSYLRRNLLRYSNDRERAGWLLGMLYKKPGVPAKTTDSYVNAHRSYQHADSGQKRPKTVTATNRGDIAATLVHIYKGGKNSDLLEALEQYVTSAAVHMPRFDGKLAIVLDVSASTKGNREREFCCVSQSVALKLVLEKCCRALHVHKVGGSGNPPRPEGDTDLASTLLDALEESPDLVAVLSDGYENIYQGDLARVAAALPGLGLNVPVVFCHSKFTGKDDLSLRRPAEGLPELAFWHEADFEDLVVSLFSMAEPENGSFFYRQNLMQKLDRFEKETGSWLNLH